MLKFEIKKLLKKGWFTLVILSACILVVYGNFYKDFSYENNKISNNVSGYTLLDEAIHEQKEIQFEYEGVDIKIKNVSDAFARDYYRLKSQFPENKENNFDFEKKSEFIIPTLSLNYYKDLKTFIEKHNLTLSDTLREDLNYTIKAYTYLDGNHIDIESFLNDKELSFQDRLMTNLDLYFGVIPLMLFMLLSAFFISDEYDHEHVFFQWTLPVKKKELVISKLISLLLLAGIYIASVFVFSFATGLIRGNLDFYVFFPIKLFTIPNSTYALIQYLVIIVFVFLFKMLVFICIGNFVGLLFKNSAKLLIVSTFFLALAVILTDAFGSLKTELNPFYNNYQAFFQGFRFVDSEKTTGYIYVYTTPTMNTLFFIVHFILILLSSLFASQLIRMEQKIDIREKNKMIKKPMNLFDWEIYKQKKFFSRKLIYSLLTIFIFIMIFVVTRYDRQTKEFLIDKNLNKQSIENEIDMVKKNIEFDSASLEKGQLSEKETEHLKTDIKEYEKRLVELEVKNQEADKLVQYYKQKDAKNYYKNLHDMYDTEKERFNFSPEAMTLKSEDLINGKISLFSNEVNKEFRERLLKANIKPLPLIYDRTLSQYDKTKDPNILKNALNSQLPYDSSSFLLLYRLFERVDFGLILIIISALIFGGDYVSDYEKGNQLEFIYTQPFKREKYFSVKYFAGAYDILKMLFFTVLIVLIFGLLFDPKNTLNYPILKYVGTMDNPIDVNNVSAYYTWITLKEYLQKALFLTVSGALFAYSLLQILSLKIKNRIHIVLTFIGILLFLLRECLYYRALPDIIHFPI